MTSQKNLRVIDSSCTSEFPIRTHDIVVKGEIIPVTFKYGEEKILPLEHGIKFLQDGFTVFEEGKKTAMDLPAFTDDTIRNRIGEDEVVAKYDELTEAALKLRAAIIPGGEHFVGDDIAKTDVIGFLKAAVIRASEAKEDDTVVVKKEIFDDMPKIDEDSFVFDDEDGAEDAPTPPAPVTFIPPIPVEPTEMEDEVALLGSTIQPATFETEDGVLTLGDVVLKAFTANGFEKSADWNGLARTSPETIENLIQAEVDKLVLVAKEEPAEG